MSVGISLGMCVTGIFGKENAKCVYYVFLYRMVGIFIDCDPSRCVGYKDAAYAVFHMQFRQDPVYLGRYIYKFASLGAADIYSMYHYTMSSRMVSPISLFGIFLKTCTLPIRTGSTKAFAPHENFLSCSCASMIL